MRAFDYLPQRGWIALIGDTGGFYAALPRPIRRLAWRA